MTAATPTALPVMQMIVALVAVLAMIVVLGWMARRLQGGKTRGNALLRARASLSLGPRERAVLVEAGGEFLLLGVANGQVRLLHHYDSPPELPNASSVSTGAPIGAPISDFLTQLRATLKGQK
ncbi:MAG: flagellar biosynthetic protein FliO [Nevskiaceae bacterium]|nr:MAG: flagellar biosynthetic protein FliO [Nevskiaceae bacterium]TBR72190.1 MAG: flagellar biosynthetic protein FliO [Nevskiaceae bacterium]